MRALLARKLAVLVPGLSVPDRGALQQRAMATLVALATDTAVRVRAAIADVLHDMPAAPRELILLLARDTVISISEPVLCLSPLLTAEDLLALIADPPSPATVTSIARRRELSADVSDAIASGADTAAITALLSNQSAAIREATLEALIARAEMHTAWHAPLVQRPCLPARAARALADLVAGDLLRQLAQRADLAPDILRDISVRLERTLDPMVSLAPPPPDYTDDQAMDAAHRLVETGRLTEDSILKAVRQGETRQIGGRSVHMFGGGTLVICLADIPAAEARGFGAVCGGRARPQATQR